MDISMITGSIKAGKNRTALAVVALVIIIVLAVTLISGPLMSAGSSTHGVSEDDEQAIVDYLLQTGDRVGVAFPSTEWQSGESGEFVLAVKNKDANVANIYYLNVYLEGLVDVSSTVGLLSDEVDLWLTYSESIAVPAGGIETTTITVTPASGAPTGGYILRAALCQSPVDTECKHTSPNVSPSIYGSVQLSFEIV